MKKKILILEDDPLFAIKLELMLVDSDYSLISIVDNIQSALEMLSTYSIDIFIADLFMENKPQGVDLIKQISPSKFPIIGITHSLEPDLYFSLKNHIESYLIKPFHKITFLASIDLAIANHKEKTAFSFLGKKYLLLSGKSGKLERIDFIDILYLESSVNYVTIYTTTGKYAKKISLNRILRENLNECFIRIHHRYIINKLFIDAFNLKEVTLKNGITLPISRSFLENIKNILSPISTLTQPK